ncbi:MAG: S8 family serine peptidase [Peptococcaceae bacterium]|nr:S8 family serine peptidase [Peptococcaceae bacterium]
MLPVKLLLVFTMLLALSVFCVPHNHETFSSTTAISFLSDRAGEITGAAAVNTPGFVMPNGLAGAGQIVALADSGLDAGDINNLHPDLRSTAGKMPKVVALRSYTERTIPDDPSGHGTHMAATIAGTGAASDGRFRGMAPEASIYFQSITNPEGDPEPPDNLADLFGPAYSAGARVHVNGWGGGDNVYGVSASQIDDFIRENPDFLAVFGVGNSGPERGSVTSEGNSKNALMVGASQLPRAAFVPHSEDTRTVAGFSSRGPTADGRVKPELLAPASAVISARSKLAEGNLPGYPEYTRMQGTSVAAAVAGGSAALIREYFKTAVNIAEPSAAFIKATLINGSRLTAEGPSEKGFGIIDLAGTVIALKEGTFHTVEESTGITHGQTLAYTYNVSETAGDFKATLVWTDPAAEPDSTKALVNNLNLIVRTPDGRVFSGNHFLNNNTPDNVNNVEQVYLPNPVPGEYTIQVTGADVSRNAVKGSAVNRQDFALVCGQLPVSGVVEYIDPNALKLVSRKSVSLSGVKITNLLNGKHTPADDSHLLPGGQGYLTSGRLYLVTSQWRNAGVRVLNTASGTVLAEINPRARLGGYVLPASQDKVLLNSLPVQPNDLPHGVEIHGVINPVDQQVRHVHAEYVDVEGVVASISTVDGKKLITLINNSNVYQLDDEVFYSYEDTYEGVDLADQPFGTGALDELQEVMPGMPILLRRSNYTDQVTYVAVKRHVKLGTVREVLVFRNEILLENDSSLTLVPGAAVVRDRAPSKLSEIKPGDHVTAVLLHDTGETVGLVVHSGVIYGKVIDFVRNERNLYLIDSLSRYHNMAMDQESQVYRWGLQSQEDVLGTGNLVRVTTGKDRQKVWRIDIGENFYKQSIFLEYNITNGIIRVAGEDEFRVSKNTRYYINDYQVMPEDLYPGAAISVEYATVPPPIGRVLVEIAARSLTPPPPMFISLIQVPGGLAITGTVKGDNKMYLWQDGRRSILAPDDENGRFVYYLEPEADRGYEFSLVALDPVTGGVTGRRSSVPVGSGNGTESMFPSMKNALSAQEQIMSRLVPKESAEIDYDPIPITRLAAVMSLARALNWPEFSGWPLHYNDTADIPAVYHPVVAEAFAREICKGYEDGTFRPNNTLSRGETAVLMTAVLRDLGIELPQGAEEINYADSAEIPAWAKDSIDVCTAVGLLKGRPGGAFNANDLITCGEMNIILERLLTMTSRYFAR